MAGHDGVPTVGGKWQIWDLIRCGVRSLLGKEVFSPILTQATRERAMAATKAMVITTAMAMVLAMARATAMATAMPMATT